MHRFRHRAALRRIRRKERIAGTGSKDHDAALFQILQCASANVRFGNLRKRQSALHAGFNAGIAQSVLQGHGVHDRGQHTHVIARGAIHAGGAESHTAEDVTAAHNDAQFDAEIKHALDFLNDARKRCTIDTELIRPHQGFAGKLQKNALVLGRGICMGTYGEFVRRLRQVGLSRKREQVSRISGAKQARQKHSSGHFYLNCVDDTATDKHLSGSRPYPRKFLQTLLQKGPDRSEPFLFN